jgi:hypothetical protein
VQDFFRFLRRFVRVWLQSFQKVSIGPQQNSIWVPKNAEFDAGNKSIEKVAKKLKGRLK